MDYRERRSHARRVYPTQYTLRMGIARVKQEEEIDKNNTRVVINLNGKSPKQGLTSTKDLTIELSEERESSYH